MNHPNAEESSGQWRLTEFTDLEPPEETDVRKKRLAQEERNKAQFPHFFGDDLWELRSNTEKLHAQLNRAIDCGDRQAEISAEQAIKIAESRDPELVYKSELEAMSEAEHAEDEKAAFEHKENAMNARSQLPHLNLDGLWVGK